MGGTTWGTCWARGAGISGRGPGRRKIRDMACAGIARARRDMNLEVQSRALACVARRSGGAPDDARCRLCLDRRRHHRPALAIAGVRVPGIVRMNARAMPRQDGGSRASAAGAGAALRALDLLRDVQPEMHRSGPAGLAIAPWEKRAHEVGEARVVAAATYAEALGATGEHVKAAQLKPAGHSGRPHPGVWARAPRDADLCLENLAASILFLGECAETAVLLRTTLAVMASTVGPDHADTLNTEGLLNVLLCLGETTEAEALSRVTLEKERRTLGRDHRETLTTSGNLASSLFGQGKHAEAVEIEREVLVQKTHLFGSEHGQTLVAANTLADSLSRCGQKATAE